MNEQLVANIKVDTNTLLDLVQSLVAQTNADPFDIGETSICLTAVGDCVEKLEQLVNSDHTDSK